MSSEALNLDRVMKVKSRVEKWRGLDKDRGDPMQDPRCYEIIEITDYPDGRREVQRVKGD